MIPESKLFFFWLSALGLSAACNFCCYKWGWHRGAAMAYQDVSNHLKVGKFPFFSIAADGRSITCHVCGMTSHNPNDVREKYCGRCHVFHEDRRPVQ